MKEAKKTGTINGPLTVSQCYFTLPTFSNSISLTVVQNGHGPAGRSARESWKEIFSDAKLREVETEKGNRKLPPRRIADLGDEAFWVGSEVIGALHVLRGESYFTISVGGAGDQTSKIEKTTALARSILPRLPRAGD